MDNRLLREVNCDSCDHLLFINDRQGNSVGYACESDMTDAPEFCETMPLHELTCHSLYEAFLEWQEGLGDIQREEG